MGKRGAGRYKNQRDMAKKQETYNEALAKLQAIVTEIEQGELDVDVLSEKVAEASRLVKVCKEKLFKADEEVKKILDNLEE